MWLFHNTKNNFNMNSHVCEVLCLLLIIKGTKIKELMSWLSSAIKDTCIKLDG